MLLIVTEQENNFQLSIVEGKKLTGMRSQQPELQYKLYFENDRLVKITNEDPKENTFENKDPDEIIELFRLAKIIVVNTKSLDSFFKRYYIKTVYKNFCPFCLYKNQFTTIKGFSIPYKDKHICIDCAEKELQRDFKAWFDAENPIDLHPLLALATSLEDVMKRLDPRINHVKRPDTTLFKVHGKTSKKVTQISLNNVPIHKKIKNIYAKRDIKQLTPVQSISVKYGLLKHKNQLIVSSTASGKTLVGELAGVPKTLKKKKLLFLVPLVAIANQKYEEFKEKYGPLGISIAIRVGFSKIELKPDVNTSPDADIIIGTYEGVDHLMRCGDSIANVGTVVLDEIHMLGEKDRGPRLDSLIARLKYFCPDAQFLGLSATIGNPEQLAESLEWDLIEYYGRPVDLEKHLLFCKDSMQKQHYLEKYVKHEYDIKSKSGYHGQSLIFTFSRRRTEELAKQLRKVGISAKAYHSGLTYRKRKQTEFEFLNGKLMAIVSTAALGAGVDFPASQIIFESLSMGIDWLTVQQFDQMCGRAGRPDYHHRGRVMVLAEVNRAYHMGQKESEDTIALKLLNGQIEPVEVDYEQEQEYEQILASLRTGVTKDDLENVLYSTLGFQSELKALIIGLQNRGLLQGFKVTPLGDVMSRYFLTTEDIREMERNISKDVQQFIRAFCPFDRVFLGRNIIRKIQHVLNIRPPSHFLSGKFISIYFDHIAELKPHLEEFIQGVTDDFFNCHCKGRPYCDCAQKNFTDYIIRLRFYGIDPPRIAKSVFRDYQLKVYEGDVYRWIDDVIRKLDAFEEVARLKKVNYTARAAKRMRWQLIKGG